MDTESEAIGKQYDTSENLKKRMKIFEQNSSESIWHRLWKLYRFQPADTILEIGGGNGEFWFQNRKNAAPLAVTFTDQSEGMVAEAKQRIDLPSFSYVVVDAHSLPFPDSQFSWVLAHFMLYHLEDPGRTFREVLRVLEPAGKFALVLFDRTTIEEPHYEIAFSLLPELRDVFDRTSRIKFFAEDARKLTDSLFDSYTEEVNDQIIEHHDAEILGDSVLSLPAFKTDIIPQGFSKKYKGKLAEYMQENGPIKTHHKTCTIIATANPERA